MEFDPELYGLPSLEVMKQIAEEFKAKGTREWIREEEMRKAEAEVNPEKVGDNNYRVNLKGHCFYVSSFDYKHIINIVYQINYLQWKLDKQEYESWREAFDLKELCRDLHKRIPLDQRPPLPAYVNPF